MQCLGEFRLTDFSKCTATILIIHMRKIKSSEQEISHLVKNCLSKYFTNYFIIIFFFMNTFFTSSVDTTKPKCIFEQLC